MTEVTDVKSRSGTFLSAYVYGMLISFLRALHTVLKITELLNNKFKQDILSLTLYFEKFQPIRKVENNTENSS